MNVCKKPCRECPFRRKSMPGWLGANSPEHFIAATQTQRMPCHLTVDYDNDEWEENQNHSPMCAGALIFLKNSCTQSYLQEVVDAVSIIPEDPENIFKWEHEFLEHHNSAPVKSWELV